MYLTKKSIAALKPCEDRLDNFIKYYGDRKLTKSQFMGLKNITQHDKLWVAFRLMTKNNIKLAVADIAESVLHIYEEQYPNDDRPRKAIEEARSGNRHECDQADAAVYAANAAANASAAAGAYAAAYAAANAAYAAYAAAAYSAANAAVYAAAYAADADAAYSADADAAAIAAGAASTADGATPRRYRAAKEKWVRKVVLKYWK